MSANVGYGITDFPPVRPPATTNDQANIPVQFPATAGEQADGSAGNSATPNEQAMQAAGMPTTITDRALPLAEEKAVPNKPVFPKKWISLWLIFTQSIPAMISKIDLSRLLNAEFLAFFRSLLGFISGNATVDNAVSAPKAALVAIINRIDDLFKNDPKSPLTEKLISLDAERDSYISGLTKICDGYRNSPVATEAEAAALLYRSIELYGGAKGINELGINAETATVDSLLKDFTGKADHTAALTTLHLSAWITALKTANQNYSTTYSSRTSDMAAADTPDTVRGKRTEAVKGWYALAQNIDANRLLATNKTDWDTVIGQINTLIDQYNDTLAVRSGRAAKKHAKEGAAEGEQPAQNG